MSNQSRKKLVSIMAGILALLMIVSIVITGIASI
jgi:hypothetical protein